MSGITLFDYQEDAVRRMKCGCILCGGVGSGKSRTALAYYYIHCGGKLDQERCKKLKNPIDLYIITTAMKRDTFEWEEELLYFGLSTKIDKIVVDSWNNIKKYKDVQNSFFIFDEQRLVGYGAWVKAFLKIVRGGNHWILLTATPGDTWSDYIPVFIANGFYKNKAEFIADHVVYSRFTKFPKIERYLGTGRLLRLRNSILVNMDFKRETVSHNEDIYLPYDVAKYKEITKNRWNPWKNEPIINAAEYCYALRKVVNSDESRLNKIGEIMEDHPRVIIFYNFDYELDLLKEYFEYFYHGVIVAEWNGHKHQDVPFGDSWAYLVQYTAGAEGWNCVRTDTIIFYSQNYSYKILVQASGRIDRLNTPFTDLYYYHLKSRSGIDLAIGKALSNKKKFNEGKFCGSQF